MTQMKHYQTKKTLYHLKSQERRVKIHTLKTEKNHLFCKVIFIQAQAKKINHHN